MSQIICFKRYLNISKVTTHVFKILSNEYIYNYAEHPRLDLSAMLSCELITVRAGRWLASRFCSLVLQHYELASTTVTGIPMKEEQNASSSANYDVEIFHSVAAHADILKLKVSNKN